MLLQLLRIAVEEHLVDDAQAARAQAHAREHDEPLVAALIEVAQVSDAALARALARRLGVELTPRLEHDEDAARELGHELARRHRIIPVDLEIAADGSRVLRLAMADPTDREALARVESSMGCRIEPVLAALGTVDDAIARAYRGLVTEVIPRAETVPAPGPAQPPPPREKFGGQLTEVTTQPFHRIEDEAPIELRLRALVELLAEKGLLGEDEWLERIRQLLQQRE